MPWKVFWRNHEGSQFNRTFDDELTVRRYCRRFKAMYYEEMVWNGEGVDPRTLKKEQYTYKEI